uniref:Uncharacterized protein n=1 Tax=Ciona savignyi TaxID=51511 RepID=H2ZLT4_CIOSA
MAGSLLDNGARVFEYVVTTGSNKPIQELRFPINVLEVFDVKELVARVMNYHDIPCFVETGLNNKLKNFVDNERQNLHDDQAALLLQKIRDDPTLIDHVADVVAEKYKNTWQEYAPPISTQPNNFPLSYHYLIHSPAMQILMQLEKKYHSAVAKLLSDKEQSLTKMCERHRGEMSRACDHVGFEYTTEDVSILATKQLADTDRMQKHWEDNYRRLTEEQKQEYCDLVIRLAEEMKQSDNKLNENGPVHNEVQRLLDHNRGRSLVSTRDPSEDVESESSVTVSCGILMEESFTINLGAQLKTMHNIRLVVADMLYFCRYSDDGEMEAQRFQTAMSLYSNSLSAIVLITDKNLNECSGIEKEFRTVCESSTEFHFETLQDQTTKVKEHALEASERRNRSLSSEETIEYKQNIDEMDGTGTLNEGDFYITKHSNLSQVHLVFHLVAEENQLRTKASLTTVTSRHSVILGLRHILKVASSHDIRHITIPLLLSHELTEEITFQWCVKRAELVMKCIKGFMMEMATWDGGISRTIQFVIPPGVSEEAFDRLRYTLPEVFRTTSTRNLTPAHRKLPTR